MEDRLSEKPLIVLCDDELQTVEGWRRELEGLDEVATAFDVAIVDENEFRRDVERLEQRRKSLREGQEQDKAPTIFDSASVLIVDYDLYGYKPDQLLTGDSIAYLARSFSSCGYIVGVNQDRIANPFDLTLMAHGAVSTDLSIGSEQIADLGLWSGDPGRWKSFRPWYWPALPERADALARLRERLEGKLDEPLAQVLALPREVLDSLPRAAMVLLDVPSRPDIGEVALREWVHGSQMGLRPGDRVADDEQVASIAAARLGKWFERVLLPSQSILVDAPHLADRRPGLLEGDTSDPDAWQQTVRLGVGPEELGMGGAVLERHRFGDDWVSRPVWLWSRIATDSDLDGALDAPRPEPRIVFTEDASRFVEVYNARRYTSGVEPPFNSRWLAMGQEGTRYLPAARLVAP
ncbi:MAG: hypothetical protein ACHQDY_01490 [Solirubrobacterales bacterium]